MLRHTPMMTNQRKTYTDEKLLDVTLSMKNISLLVEEIVHWRINHDDEEKPQAAVNENPYLSRFY